MQDWREQAQKNNLVLLEEGACQLCGSNTTKGIAECLEKAAHVTYRLSQGEGVEYMTIFLSVDSHALQHPEIHGRWNNHLHLSRLYLVLREKLRWQHKYTPVLSGIVNDYKKRHPNEVIEPPEVKKRGITTVTDVEAADSDRQYIERVREWADGVFESFGHGHEIASEIAKACRRKIRV